MNLGHRKLADFDDSLFVQPALSKRQPDLKLKNTKRLYDNEYQKRVDRDGKFSF